MKEKIQELLTNARSYLTAFIGWLIIGTVLGSVCGAVGAGFSQAINFGIGLRQKYDWLLYLLPVGGIISVTIYKLLRVSNVGTNNILESAREKGSVSPLLAPAIFAGTVISHTFGASAGREGAALQIGGSISSLFCRILRLNEQTKHILTMCGMAALFSALFGTPLGAAVFAIEVASVGYFCSAAVFPCLISSISAYFVATSLGTHAERFAISSLPKLDLDSLWKVAVIGVLGAFVSILFCKCLNLFKNISKKHLKNEFLRVIIGGGLLILLPIIIGTRDYNGGGIEIINRIFEKGEVRYEAFLLKILFTSITVAAGYKGGEIVPTMFIGATMGGSMALILDLNPGFGAAVGIAALFCGVTNCPIGTLFLCIEMFGGEGILFFAISAGISFILSGKSSLYSKQRFIFSKLNDNKICSDTE